MLISICAHYSHNNKVVLAHRFYKSHKHNNKHSANLIIIALAYNMQAIRNPYLLRQKRIACHTIFAEDLYLAAEKSSVLLQKASNKMKLFI